jgi:hypothetical protein
MLRKHAHAEAKGPEKTAVAKHRIVICTEDHSAK